MNKTPEQGETKPVEDLRMDAEQAAAVKGGGVPDVRRAGERPVEY